MTTQLELYVKDRILAHYRSQRAFAAAAMPDASVEVAGARVLLTLTGARPAAAEHLAAWTKALHWTDSDPEAEVLAFLFGLTHLPPALHPLFTRLFDESRQSRGLPPLPVQMG